MSVKRNSLSGLKALIDVASGTATGGATDDLGEGQVYVAEIIAQIHPEKEFKTKYSEDGAARTSKLYKIKLEEELGNSVTGGELLPSEVSDLDDLLPDGNKEQKEAMGNFLINMLPEGIFIASETPEFPGIGDEVYATADGGIEGRYLLSLKNSMAKGVRSGTDQPLTAEELASAAKAFAGKNGSSVPEQERKAFLLNFIKKDMVRDAVDIKSDFGARTHPVTGDTSKMHYGTDVGTGRTYATLRAPKAGTITTAIFQGETSRWKNGNYIKMRHDDGSVSVFLHLHTIDEKIRPVTAGQQKETITSQDQIPESQKSRAPFSQRTGEERAGGRDGVNKIKVEQGDVLGTIGTSGTSTGIHLHWQFSSQKDPYDIVFNKWGNELA
jgi:hypothetical protein